MKRKILTLITVFVLLMISGCSNVNDFLINRLEENALENAGILEDTEYQDYEKLMSSGQLDENGKYLGTVADMDENDDVEEASGQIHVTFANNSHISFIYYLDAEHTEQINTSNCYLNPGDCIYASDPKLVDPYSDMYVFSEFRILKFDGDNQQETVTVIPGDKDLIFEIPEDYEGEMLSLMPLGRYKTRSLTFRDYQLDGDGNEEPLNGIWRIDSAEYYGGNVEISSIVDYKVTYDYSDFADSYYYVEADPEPFYMEDDGIVEFRNATAQDGYTEYRVRLHRFISVKVVNEDYSIINPNIIRSLSTDGIDQENLEEKELTLDGLRSGSVIILRVDSNYKVTVSGLEITGPTDLEDGQKYKITVPETVEPELEIIISKKTATLGGFAARTVNNAHISVTDKNGNELQDGDEVDDDEKVTVTISPAGGYYVTGKKVDDGVYQATMKYKEYVSDIDEIIEEHPIKKLIYVTLDVSDNFGTCVYTVDGEEVSGTIGLREGQKVKLEYILTDSRYQIDTGWFGNKTKKTASIEITEKYDGQTLSREDFDIQIKDK